MRWPTLIACASCSPAASSAPAIASAFSRSWRSCRRTNPPRWTNGSRWSSSDWFNQPRPRPAGSIYGRHSAMGDRQQAPESDQPLVNIVGELVALGPLRRDLLPLYLRWRSEEHTSELQSRQYLVCRLLLE